MTSPLRYQVIVGKGTPRASHSRVTTVSNRAVTSVVMFPLLIEGGTERTKKNDSFCCCLCKFVRCGSSGHLPYTLRLKSFDCLPAVFMTLH